MQDIFKLWDLRIWAPFIISQIEKRDNTKKHMHGFREGYRACLVKVQEVLITASFGYENAIQTLMESDENYMDFDDYASTYDVEQSDDMEENDFAIFPPIWYTSANGIHIMEDNGDVAVLVYCIDGMIFRIWAVNQLFNDIHDKCFLTLSDAMGCANGHPNLLQWRDDA